MPKTIRRWPAACNIAEMGGNNLVLAILISLGTLVASVTDVWGVGSSRCSFDEDEGCFSVFILGVEYDVNSPELVSLVRSGPVADLSDGLVIFRKTERGEIARTRGSQIFTVYAWNLKPGASPTTYGYGGNSKANPPPQAAERIGGNPPAFITETLQKWGSLRYEGAWRIEVKDGLGAWQIPWDRIDPERTLILVCPPEGSVYPGVDRGLWTTPGHWPNFEARGLEGIVTPFVFFP